MANKSQKASILLIVFSFLLLITYSMLADGYTDRSQKVIIKNIQHYLNKFLFPSNENERQIKEALIRRFNYGYCSGLSSLWLYTKWLQTQPKTSNKHRDDYQWFESSVDLIVTWSDQKKLTEKEMAAFEKFILLIDNLQNVENYRHKAAQGELDKILRDKKGRAPKKEYSIVLPFKGHDLELRGLFNTQNFVQDGKLIYIVAGNHATAVFKDKEKYYFYDPNSYSGELVANSIDELVLHIFKAYNSGCTPAVAIAIVIYSFDTVSAPYPDQRVILQNVLKLSNGRYKHSQDAMAKEAEYTYEDQALAMAAFFDCRECLQCYLQKVVDPNIQDNDGWTPLGKAAYAGNFEIVKLLLEDQRVDPNIRDNDGWTPLLFAIQTNNYEITKLLLKDQRVDPSIQTNDGLTPHRLASDKNNIEIVKLLATCRYDR